MNLLLGLGSFLGLGAAAGGSGIITTLAGAGGAAASGLSSLQGLATMVSVVGTIGSGLAGMAEANAEAADREFQAKEEFVQAKETSAALKMELARTLSDQAVTFASSGVDLSSVSVASAKRQATQSAERELSISSNEALARNLAQKRAARAARARGQAALFSSVVGAAQTGLNAAADRAGLGTIPGVGRDPWREMRA